MRSTGMNATLASSIENLYKVFGKYTTEGIHHCDCGCIDPEDVKKLHSKPLRELELDDLISYQLSALDTWGDVEHYKHFLPRILEIQSLHQSFNSDLDDIFIKLERAEWRTWPPPEVEAIKDYVLADWTEYVHQRISSIGADDLKIYEKFLGFKKVLKSWEVTRSDYAVRNFVYFFYNYGTEILYNGIRINGLEQETVFLDWISKSKLAKNLEATFFQQEPIDGEYAEKISIVLQMIEQKFRDASTSSKQ